LVSDLPEFISLDSRRCWVNVQLTPELEEKVLCLLEGKGKNAKIVAFFSNIDTTFQPWYLAAAPNAEKPVFEGKEWEEPAMVLSTLWIKGGILATTKSGGWHYYIKEVSELQTQNKELEEKSAAAAAAPAAVAPPVVATSTASSGAIVPAVEQKKIELLEKKLARREKDLSEKEKELSEKETKLTDLEKKVKDLEKSLKQAENKVVDYEDELSVLRGTKA